MGHTCDHCVAHDSTMVACEICFGMVLAVHHDDHLKWHRTMTNLPAKSSITVVPDEPIRLGKR